MMKGTFLFRASGAFSTFLLIASGISFLGAIWFFVRGGQYHLLIGNVIADVRPALWSLFFLLLGVVCILLNVLLHRLCRDIADLLKAIEEKQTHT
jgi:hypothetical protein